MFTYIHIHIFMCNYFLLRLEYTKEQELEWLQVSQKQYWGRTMEPYFLPSKDKQFST